VSERREGLDPGRRAWSLRQQCALLGLSRSGWYYRPRGEGAANAALMRRIDEAYTRRPFYGVRIRMDVRGRCFDNLFVERLWRTVKYEEVYLGDYAEAASGGWNVSRPKARPTRSIG
jgi:putative transposase